jgi:RHS repeat-associated protein
MKFWKYRDIYDRQKSSGRNGVLPTLYGFSWVAVRDMLIWEALRRHRSGSGPTALPLLDYVGDDPDVWYDVYVQLDDDAVVVYAGERGQAMTKIVDTTTDVTSSTDRIQFTVENLGANGSQFLFDDIKVMTRELSDKTMAMTYGAGNQLTNVVRGDGVEIDLEYDAWGRVSHADMIVPGVDTFTIDYTYWFGDKLKRVESDIPGMPAVVHYLYDGLGKRRFKRADDEDIIHYRWDAGYSVLAEYEDGNTTAWDIEGFKRFFVPKGHTAFAEATPDANGNPIYGAYTYLAHDHLGTGRFAYNQAKAQIGTVEHDPYGERITQTGYTPYHEFTGKPFDSETGMYYFPFRYYHPHINRWTTPDPLGTGDGPNVYGYVGGDPIGRFDPFGLKKCCGKKKRCCVPERLDMQEKHLLYLAAIVPCASATLLCAGLSALCLAAPLNLIVCWKAAAACASAVTLCLVALAAERAYSAARIRYRQCRQRARRNPCCI